MEDSAPYVDGFVVAVPNEKKDAYAKLATEIGAIFRDYGALAAGAKEPRPMQDHGFMVQRTIENPDGYIWAPFWMDPAHVQPAS